MKKISFILSVLMFFSCSTFSYDVKEISPLKAFEMLKNPSTYLVDVRSIAEYVFAGHPEMAYNIPLKFWSEKQQELVKNEHFLIDIKSCFTKDDTLIFLCRSGGRSLKAAQLAKEEGFANVFSINEGFEGEKNEKGYRTVNGWKNRQLPYTYTVKKELMYRYNKSSLK
ncbi:MAG: rhodanese-like domain-containing protein [Candidatus Aminicenantaceae bacterium]